MAESTEGMYQDSSGAWVGAVGISLSDEQLNDSKSTNFSLTKKDIDDSIELFMSSTPTTLLQSLDVKNKITLLQIQSDSLNAELIKNSNLTIAKNIINQVKQSEYNMLVQAQILESLQLLTEQIKTNSTNLVSSVDSLTTVTENQELSVAVNSSGSLTGTDMSGVVSALEALTTETKNQQLSATFGDVNLSMGDLTELNTKMTDTFEKVSQGIEVQKEHYDYLKNGSENLKDSKGQLIKPREVHALKSAEDYIYKEVENTFDIKDVVFDTLGDDLEDDVLSEDGVNLPNVLSQILNVDKSKFDFEYSSSLYSKDDTQGGV
jgi:hypothetical protein